MKKAILTYQIYDKVFSSVFHTKIDGTFISDCKLFELSFKKSTTKGSTVYGGKIIWIDSKRPPVGLKLLNLEVEVQNWDSYEGTKILQHGYQSWSFTSSYSEREKDVSPIFGFLQYSQENVYTKQSGREGDFQSEGFLLAHSESADSGFLIGLLDTQNENVKFHIKLNDEGRPISLGMIYDFYFSPESRSELKVKLPEIEYVPFKGTPEKEMEKYFSKLKKKYVKKQFPKKVPTGWCSWYYYYTAITEEIIIENLREVKRKRLPLSFFQIDDGYQREIGDWTTTNEKFPKGMRYLAEEIKAENLTPGIWLAPFLVRKKSEFFQKFPEAVLKNESGNPVPALWNYLWGWDYTYCIDVTHPAAINFMETTFRTLVHEFKYPYLKLDFLYAACLPGVTYKRNLPPATRYVNTIKLIRKIVGKDVFLLGCGAPTMPSIGLFDGMRIGCDVAPFWYPEKIRRHLRDKNALCTEKALINAINRSQMHRNFWLNDPDCLLVRKEKNEMSYDQTILMATVMSISGGMLLVSDNLKNIEEDRLGILRKSLELNSLCQSRTPLPLGTFENEFPRGLYNPAGFIGIWNPTETDEWVEVKIPIPFKQKNPKDFWTGESLSNFSFDPKQGRIKLKLKPFGSAIIKI